MKWIVIIAGVLVLAGIVIAVIGSTIPVKHHATRKARFRQTPDAVYAVISGPPEWRPDVKASGSLPDVDGRRRWWEQDAHGRKTTFEEVESSPTRLVTRIADRNLPYGGTWTVELQPAAPGECEVRVTEDGEIYNVLFRFLSRYVFGYYGSIDSYLRNLGAKFGEKPELEA